MWYIYPGLSTFGLSRTHLHATAPSAVRQTATRVFLPQSVQSIFRTWQRKMDGCSNGWLNPSSHARSCGYESVLTSSLIQGHRGPGTSVFPTHPKKSLTQDFPTKRTKQINNNNKNKCLECLSVKSKLDFKTSALPPKSNDRRKWWFVPGTISGGKTSVLYRGDAQEYADLCIWFASVWFHNFVPYSQKHENVGLRSSIVFHMKLVWNGFSVVFFEENHNFLLLCEIQTCSLLQRTELFFYESRLK